jgi:hypothetical protein
MGLDNFWVDQNNKQAPVKANLNLCGGLLSDSGNSSFRGKVYDHLVSEVTGQTLYSDDIPNELVAQMAEKLSSCTISSAQTIDPNIVAQELEDLKLMFKLHAEAGHKLVGWW